MVGREDGRGEHPFLAGLSAEHLRRVLGIAQPCRYAADEVVFRAHDPADHFYLVSRGRVALILDVPHHSALTIQTVPAGQALGWSWLLPPQRWHFEARALDPVEALALEAGALHVLMADDPCLGFQVLKRVTATMADRLQATRLQLLDVYAARKEIGP